MSEPTRELKTEFPLVYDLLKKQTDRIIVLEAVAEAAEPANQHACFTGDCPHVYRCECFAALRKWAAELRSVLDTAKGAVAARDEKELD